MKPGTTYRRKHYFISRKFQLRYVGIIFSLVFLTAVMCSYITYYTMMLTVGEKLANVYPQGRLMAIVNTVNFRIFVSLLLVAPFVMIIGVYFSHKIAGPVYRIEKFLASMANGDISLPLRLRKHDELMSLAGGINKVIDSTKAIVNKEKSAINAISMSMENLRKLGTSKPVDNAALERELDKLNEGVSSMRTEVEKYKI